MAKDRRKKTRSGQGFYKEDCFDLDIIQGHWKPLICRLSPGKVCACFGQREKMLSGQEFFKLKLLWPCPI